MWNLLVDVYPVIQTENLDFCDDFRDDFRDFRDDFFFNLIGPQSSSRTYL